VSLFLLSSERVQKGKNFHAFDWQHCWLERVGEGEREFRIILRSFSWFTENLFCFVIYLFFKPVLNFNDKYEKKGVEGESKG
jgi:hypothetical protein